MFVCYARLFDLLVQPENVDLTLLVCIGRIGRVVLVVMIKCLHIIKHTAEYMCIVEDAL